MKDKLVRDEIPNMIKKKGEEPSTHVADEEEYWERLKQKLDEEVDEFLESETAEELADVLEVIHAMSGFKDISLVDLEELRQEKRKERGGFEKGIVLEGND